MSFDRSLLRRSRYGTLGVPPKSVDARQDGSALNSALATPLRRALRYAINRQEAGRASIVVLYVPRHPLNVRRFVMTIPVNPVKCVFAPRSRANVGKKRLERRAPPLAHRDASAAIVDEGAVVGPETAFLDLVPNAVLRRATSMCTPGVTVRRPTVSRHLVSVATARLRVASPKMVLRHIYRRAAITAAQKPTLLVAATRRGGEHRETRKSLPDGNFIASHTPNYIPMNGAAI